MTNLRGGNDAKTIDGRDGKACTDVASKRFHVRHMAASVSLRVTGEIFLHTLVLLCHTFSGPHSTQPRAEVESHCISKPLQQCSTDCCTPPFAKRCSRVQHPGQIIL